MSDLPSRRVDLDSLLSLLRSEDSELAAASAMVLGACAPSTPQVLGELLARIESASSSLKPYLIEALAKIDPGASFPTVARFLVSSGPLREQAVRLLADRGQAALADLRSLAERTGDGDIAAVIRAIAAIPGRVAREILLGLLPGASFERAKALVPALAAHTEAATRAEQEDVSRALLRLLDRTEPRPRPTEAVALLKLLADLHAQGAERAFLSRAAPGHDAEVRRHALIGLRRLPWPWPEDVARSARSDLQRLFHEEADPALQSAVIPLLGRFGSEGVSLEELASKSRDPSAAVARAALECLADRASEVAAGELFAVLREDRTEIAEAAALHLRELPAILPRVVLAHEDPQYAERREALRGIAEHHRDRGDRAALRALYRQLLDSTDEPELLHSRLVILARIDLARANRAANARAYLALRAARPERAILLLEPLVRERLATPVGRYLLALAHLSCLEPASHPGNPHAERAIQLLTPLARLREFPLLLHLSRDRLFPAAAAPILIGSLALASPPKSDIAATLAARFGEGRPAQA